MSDVVLNPCTTPNGADTSDCIITNTTDPNKDFHPVRDFMVGTERTAKVERVSYEETLTYDFDGQCECGKWVDALWQYCPSCGARLEWK